MNGAARCSRRWCQSSPRCVARGGARRGRASLVPWFHLWDPGARPRNPREWISPRSSSRPFPHRGGQRRPRRCGDGHLPGARGRGGGGRRVVAPGSPFLPHPACRWVWASSAGTCLAEEREKRSAPCRFCKIAVTTLPRVWVGEWDESDSENGNRNRGFHLTTHLLLL